MLPPPPPLTATYSTPGVQDSLWCSQDFMLGVGMVLIQENTHKIVVVHEPSHNNAWFFPRGRKDVGESLEQAALREAYEESGYRAEFMPLFNPHRAPASLHDHGASEHPNIEPISVSLTSWQPGRQPGGPGIMDNGGEYLTTWYVGRIAENAVRETGTGIGPDEQNFESYLLSIEDALSRVSGREKTILLYAWNIYNDTVTELQRQALEAEIKETDKDHSEPQQRPSRSVSL